MIINILRYSLFGIAVGQEVDLTIDCYIFLNFFMLFKKSYLTFLNELEHYDVCLNQFNQSIRLFVHLSQR